MAQSVSHQEHRRHVHHTLLYVAALSALVLTLVTALFTYHKQVVCQERTGLEDAAYGYCDEREQSRFGWPFQQTVGQTVWPLFANFAFFFVIIFGAAKTEAHLKGHMRRAE